MDCVNFCRDCFRVRGRRGHTSDNPCLGLSLEFCTDPRWTLHLAKGSLRYCPCVDMTFGLPSLSRKMKRGCRSAFSPALCQPGGYSLPYPSRHQAPCAQPGPRQRNRFVIQRKYSEFQGPCTHQSNHEGKCGSDTILGPTNLR